MAKYDILVTTEAAKEIEGIPSRDDRRKVLERIRSLAEQPRPVGAIKLSGQEKYRVRQGRYRILYEIQDSCLVITVVKVADRKEAYRNK